MSLRKRIVAGSAILAGGQVIGQLCALGRNIIIARLISPENFGIAATFVITVSLFEMISNLAVDRLLVQASDGDDPRFQATAHLFQVLRGVLNGLLVFLLAGPACRLFGVLEAQSAFQWLALVPILRGFSHLDVKRLHRELRFKRDATVDALSQLVLVCLAWPLGWWLGDYRAMLWLLITQAAVGTVMTHLLAKREYRWGIDRAYLRRMISFGWPLAINGLLLFLILQGDRVIVGIYYDSTVLGLYSAAFLVTVTPAFIGAKIYGALTLPVLAEQQHRPEIFRLHYRTAARLLALAAGTMGCVLILLGSTVITLTFGSEYGMSESIVVWLAAASAMRLMRAAPSQAALALGDTRNLLLTNVIRCTAIVPMLLVVHNGAAVAWIPAIAFVSELAAGVGGTILLKRVFGLPSSIFIAPALATSGVLCLSAILVYIGPFSSISALRYGLAAACIAIGVAALIVMCKAAPGRNAGSVADPLASSL